MGIIVFQVSCDSCACHVLLQSTLVQIASVTLALGLALDIRKEKRLAKEWVLKNAPKAKVPPVNIKMTKLSN